MVGLGFPERFALGAAIGVLLCFIRAKAMLLFGIRSAMVFRFVVVSLGRVVVLERLNIRVRGPGQNWFIRVSAFWGISSVS